MHSELEMLWSELWWISFANASSWCLLRILIKTNKFKLKKKKNDCFPGLFSNQFVFTSVWLSKFYISTNVTSLNSFGSFAALPALYWILCTLLSLARLPIVYPLWFISTFLLHTVLGLLNFFQKKKKHSKDLQSVCGGENGWDKRKKKS